MLIQKPRAAKLIMLVFLTGVISLVVGLIVIKLPEKATYWANPYQVSARDKVVAHSEEKRKAEIKLRFEQGVAMMQLGQYEHAITAFHRVLALNPKLPEAHVNMGYAFFEMKDFAGAQRFFEGALALAPSLHNASYGLAISLLAQGNPEAAKVHMQRYLASIEQTNPYRPKAESKLREIDSALMAKQH